MLGARMDVSRRPAAFALPAERDGVDGHGGDGLHARRLRGAGQGGHPARRLGPDGITLTQRGKGTNTRHINNIAMEAGTSPTRSS